MNVGDTITLTSNDSLLSVLDSIEKNVCHAAIILDSQGHLIDLITDGDVRRAILRGSSLNDPVDTIGRRRKDSRYPKPIFVEVGTSMNAIQELMTKHRVRQIPVLDPNGKFVDVVEAQRITDQSVVYPVTAVIMAGGVGRRLTPLTTVTPKPMLEVGGMPLLERTIVHLVKHGITSIYVSVNYKKEIIKSYFQDGKRWGADIHYIEESQPLGTVGSIKLLDEYQEQILIFNGDIFTDVNLSELIEFHLEMQGDLTIAVKDYTYSVPYGVVRMTDGFVISIDEKPSYSHFINAGVYVMNSDILKMVPGERAFDMSELVSKLIKHNKNVCGFPIFDYWMDIGAHEDYEKANKDASNMN